MLKQTLRVLFLSIVLFCPPAFSEGFFESKKLSVRLDNRFGIADKSSLVILLESVYPERIGFIELKGTIAETGNTQQYEKLESASISLGGDDEESRLNYAFTLRTSTVNFSTVSLEDERTIDELVVHTYLTIPIRAQDFADELNLILGGAFYARWFGGALPQFALEENNQLEVSAALQANEVWVFDTLMARFVLSDADAPNQYTGLSLNEVCDIGLTSPRTFSVEGRKVIFDSISFGAQVGVEQNYCEDQWPAFAGVSFGYRW